MKQILLSGILALAVVISACDTQSSVNSPVTTGAPTTDQFMKMLDQMDLSEGQLAVIDEMFYMGEDLGSVLTPKQLTALESVTGRTGMIANGPFDRRRAIDMEAMMYLRLILAANPDMSDEQKEALKTLIANNYADRMAAIAANAGDPAAIRAALARLHQELMDALTAALTPEQRAAVEALKAKIEAEREERRKQMEEIRINAQVRFMTQALGLNAEQAGLLKAALALQLAEIAKLRAQYKDNPEGFREALKALQARHEETLKTILTPEQYAKWLALRTGRTGGGQGGGGGRGGIGPRG